MLIHRLDLPLEDLPIVASDVQFLGRRSTAPKADSFPDPDEVSPDELPDDRPF